MSAPEDHFCPGCGHLYARCKCSDASTPDAATGGDEGLAKQCWQDLLDVDDRNSPADYPDMCLITFKELERFMALAALRRVSRSIAIPATATPRMKNAGATALENSKCVSEPADMSKIGDGAFNEIWQAMLATLPIPAHEEGETPDVGHPHLIAGEFQSDKYPTTPRGKVPLSVKDPTAQDLLWTYAQRRRAVDAEFAADLEIALKAKGYTPPAPAVESGEITWKMEGKTLWLSHANGGNHSAEGFERELIAEIERLRSTRTADEVTDTVRLDFLEGNHALETSYGEATYPGADGEASYFVHRRGGSRNDREWEQISEADTLREAIDKARAALTPAQEKK